MRGSHMDYVSLGRTGLRVSKVGLGTWQVGSSLGMGEGV